MRFLAGLLLSVVAAALPGPGDAPITIETGSGKLPVLSQPIYNLPLSHAHGAFRIATNGARAIQFHQLGGSPDITCDRLSILNDSWYLIAKTVSCSITTTSDKVSLQLNLLVRPAAEVAKLPAGQNGEIAVVSSGDPLIATLIFEPASPAGASAGEHAAAQAAPSGQNTPGPAQDHAGGGTHWLIVTVLAVGILGIAYLLYTGKLKALTGGGKPPAGLNLNTPFAPPPASPSAPRSLPDRPTGPSRASERLNSPAPALVSTLAGAPAPAGVEAPVLNSYAPGGADQIAALQGEIKELAQTVEHFSQAIERLAQEQEFLKTRAEQFAPRQALMETEETLKKELKQVRDQVAGLPSQEQLKKQFGLLHREVSSFEDKLAKQQEEIIKKLSAGAGEKLTALLKVLPEDYLSTAGGQDAAKLLDQAVSDFFVQSVPARDGLKQCKERARAFAASIDQLLGGLSSEHPELEERMSPLLDQARRVQEEAEDLLAAAASRMRLRFDVEFYASKANRERLIDGIASGLKKQIVRIAKPMEYFDHRLLSLAAATAQAAADFLDANVDPQRGNTRVQGLLKDIFGAGGLEQIAPAPNEEFRATEHSVVQMVPRPGGTGAGGPGGSPSVARLVARGFRRDKEVLRKASVILYE